MFSRICPVVPIWGASLWETRMSRYRKWHNKRQPEDGFTLIELAVVMLIIAILVVVSLAFFGLIGTAHTSVALQDLKGAQAAAQTLWAQNNGTFNGVTQAQLSAAEPGVLFESINGNGYNSPGDGSQSVPTTPSNPNSVAWNWVTDTGNNANSIVLVMYSNSNGGECVALLDIEQQESDNPVGFSPGTWWGESWTTAPTGATAATDLAAPSGGTCTAPIADSNNMTSATGWSQTPPST